MRRSILLLVLLLSITGASAQQLVWQQTGPIGPPRRDVGSIVVAADGSLLAAVSGLGMYRSTDDGITWSQAFPHSAYFFTDIGVRRNGSLFVQFGTELRRSTDHGVTWLDIYDRADLRGEGVWTLYVDRQDRVYLGTYGGRILRSSDDGESWTEIRRSDGANITGMTQAAGGSLFVFTGHGQVLRSQDDGGTWSVVHTVVGFEPSAMDIVADSSGGVIFGSTTPKVVRSTDDGATWSDRPLGIDRMPAGTTTLVVASSGRIYAGGWSGVLVSADDGATWNDLSGEVAGEEILSIMTTPGGAILAGASSGRIFRAVLPASADVDAANRATIGPLERLGDGARASVVVTLTRASHVRIALVDIAGRTVRAPYDGLTAPGTHELALDLRGIPSGFYVAHIVVDGRATTRPLPIAR